MTRKKRKYVRLSPSTWAELRALWETGDHGLAELSDQYGVSPRAIQSHLKKLGSVKGAKAAALAAAVMTKVFKDELNDQDTLTHRAKETREAAYTNAVIIDGLIKAQLALAQKDPTQVYKAMTAFKMLSLGAAAVNRRSNLTPDRRSILTPLIDVFWR